MLATTTGWSFRDASVGNPGDIYQLLGSYIPFATTKAAGISVKAPCLSVEDRYRRLQRVRSAATDLIRGRFLLPEDLAHVLARAKSHWRGASTSVGGYTGRCP